MEVIEDDDLAEKETGVDHMPINEDDADMDDELDDWEDDDPEEDEAAYARG